MDIKLNHLETPSEDNSRGYSRSDFTIVDPNKRKIETSVPVPVAAEFQNFLLSCQQQGIKPEEFLKSWKLEEENRETIEKQPTDTKVDTEDLKKIPFVMPLLRKETLQLSTEMKEEIEGKVHYKRKVKDKEQVSNQPTIAHHYPSPPPLSSSFMCKLQNIKQLQKEKEKQMLVKEKQTPEQQAQQQQQTQKDEAINNYISELAKHEIGVLKLIIPSGGRKPNLKNKDIQITTREENQKNTVEMPRSYAFVDTNFKTPLLLVETPPGSELTSSWLQKSGQFTMSFDDSPNPRYSRPSHYVFALPKLICCELLILILCRSRTTQLTGAAINSILRCMSNQKTSTIWDVGSILRQLVKDMYAVHSELSPFLGKTNHRKVLLKTKPSASAATKLTRKPITIEEVVQAQMTLIDEQYIKEVEQSIHYLRELHFQTEVMRLSKASNIANMLSAEALTCSKCQLLYCNATEFRLHHMICGLPMELQIFEPIVSLNKSAGQDKKIDSKLWRDLAVTLHQEDFEMNQQQHNSLLPSSSASSSVYLQTKVNNNNNNNNNNNASPSPSSSSTTTTTITTTGVEDDNFGPIFHENELHGIVPASEFFHTELKLTATPIEEEETVVPSSTLVSTTTTTPKRKLKVAAGGPANKKIKLNNNKGKNKTNNNAHAKPSTSSSSSSSTSTTTSTTAPPSSSSSSSADQLGEGETFFETPKWKRWSEEKKENLLQVLEIRRQAVLVGGDKPYVCQLCSNSYSSYQALTRHAFNLSESHPQLPRANNIIFCEVCWYFVSNDEGLYNHTAENHPHVDLSKFKRFYAHCEGQVVEENKYNCQKCPGSFRTKVALEKHQCI